MRSINPGKVGGKRRKLAQKFQVISHRETTSTINIRALCNLPLPLCRYFTPITNCCPITHPSENFGWKLFNTFTHTNNDFYIK